MGIAGLTKLIGDHAPSGIKEGNFNNYFGRKIAVDASMHIYAFLSVIGRQGDQLLTNESGEVTSHLQGMFYRTARMLEAGMKPVYVFEGKPPALKLEQLRQRREKRDAATEELAAAKEAGDQAAVEKYAKRTLRVTPEHNEECKRLLRLMGVPVLDAPSEAEAQCARLCREGLVYGVATEDMDCLTFGCPVLIRHLMASQQSQNEGKTQVLEINLAAVLAELGVSMDQFIDLCIMCGCDYATNIKGIGGVRALSLLKQHGSLDAVLKTLDRSKFEVPNPYPYKEAAHFFREPEVLSKEELPAFKWTAPDEEALVAFLAGEKGFSEDRVRAAVKRINAAKGKAAQGRMENFFAVLPKPAGSSGAAKPLKPGEKKTSFFAKKAQGPYAKEAAAAAAKAAAKKKAIGVGGKAGAGVKKGPIGAGKK